MNLIIASKEDSASINLRNRLLEMSIWEANGKFDNNTLWKLTKDYGDFCKKGTRLITINKIHIIFNIHIFYLKNFLLTAINCSKNPLLFERIS